MKKYVYISKMTDNLYTLFGCLYGILVFTSFVISFILDVNEYSIIAPIVTSTIYLVLIDSWKLDFSVVPRFMLIITICANIYNYSRNDMSDKPLAIYSNSLIFVVYMIHVHNRQTKLTSDTQSDIYLQNEI